MLGVHEQECIYTARKDGSQTLVPLGEKITVVIEYLVIDVEVLEIDTAAQSVCTKGDTCFVTINTYFGVYCCQNLKSRA